MKQALPHSAPAFQLEVRALVIWRLLHAVSWALALVALCALVSVHLHGAAWSSGWPMVGLMLAFLTGAWGGWVAAQPPWGGLHLGFDGQGWWCRALNAPLRDVRSDRHPVEVRMRMDFGGFLLLQLQRSGSPRWSAHLALSRSVHGGHWLALRRALFAPRAARRRAQVSVRPSGQAEA